MKLIEYLFLMLIIFFFNPLFSQKKCKYEINVNKILKNESLDNFILNISKDDFKILKKKQEIQSFILDDLDCITGDFSIANSTEKFQSGCIGESKLPKRKILFLSKNKSILILTYLNGGFASVAKILLIEFNKEHIIDLWSGDGNTKLDSKKELLNFIMENRYKKNAFNTKKINL